MARSWLALLALVTCAAPARAQPSAEAVRLQYAAPAACPDATRFVEQVRERTPRWRLAEPGELARTFTITVVADARGFSGNIELLDESGTSVSRRVPGEQCDAVVSSLALITALSLDASLRSDEDEPAAAAASPPPTAATPPTPKVPPASSGPVSPTRVMRRSLDSARVGLLAGYGSAQTGVRLGLVGELVWRSALALRLTAHYSWHELTVDAGRSAKLRAPGLAASLCPRRFRSGAWVLAACAAFDLGSLRAVGVRSERLTSVRADAIWWASAGAELGVAWEPGPPFWVELRGAVEFPLRAGYQFRFENPSALAYRVPYVAGSAAIVSGLRFW